MDAKKINRLRIVHFPDPILKKPAKEVAEIDAEVIAVARRMLELMREAKGVGLAAPQVGLSLRLFVCNPTGEPGDDLICVNPVLSRLDGAEEKEEGCLSIPGATVTMRRAMRVTLYARDLEGRLFQREGVDLPARIFQHEMDHLDGKLIIDNMSASDAIANRKVLKQLKEEWKARKPSPVS